MSQYLMRTKLRIPAARAGLVVRERLVARLGAAVAAHRLVVLAAPAGYGKTTLVADWAAGELPTGMRVAWLSLDGYDDEPVRFLIYVVAALQRVVPELGRDIAGALQSSQPPDTASLLAALVNELDACDHAVALVLDDYHAIQSLAIHQAITFLLEHAPPHFHLVLLTRADPLLPLARFRGRGQLLELRQEDLRFTPEETAQFLNGTMALTLPPTDLAALNSRTEGWIAGLQIAALSLQRHADPSAFVREFSGGNRYILEYLLKEVLNQQPEAVQDFLIRTSVLERLSGPLCEAVVGSGDAQATLAYLERANLFLVPFDEEQRWYRYHHLFAGLLQQRLRRTADADVVAGLYRRAGAWHEREGQIDEAVSYALAAPDHDWAAELVARHALPLFYRGETALVRGWLRALPAEVIRPRALLCAMLASCTVLTEQTDASISQAEGWLDAAEAALRQGPPDEEAAGFTLKMRAYLARFRGEPPGEVAALSRAALARLPQGTSWFRSALLFNLGAALWEMDEEAPALEAWTAAHEAGVEVGDLFNALSAVTAQAMVARMRGRLHAAAALCRQTLAQVAGHVERSGRSLPAAGQLHVMLGSLQVEWNALEEAERSLTHGLSLLALSAMSVSQFEGHIALARLRQAEEDGEGALRLIAQAEDLYPRARLGSHTSLFRRQIALLADYRVRLRLRQAGDNPRILPELEAWATGDAAREPRQMTLARVILGQHRLRAPVPGASLPALLATLQAQAAQAQALGRTGWQIEALILQALAHHLREDLRGALEVLQAALVLAAPEGYTRIFLDEGPPLTELVRLGLERGRWVEPLAIEHARYLLDVAPAASDAAPARGAASALIEPLSERELEVLCLLNAGLSNQQIADRIVVTLGTAKTHIHNIYGKLGVERRTQALARARELGLL